MRYTPTVRSRLPALLLTLLAVLTAPSAHAYSERWQPSIARPTSTTTAAGSETPHTTATSAWLCKYYGASSTTRSPTYDPPGSGLFQQRDPMGFVDSVNLYAGFGWDPVNRRDPTDMLPPIGSVDTYGVPPEHQQGMQEVVEKNAAATIKSGAFLLLSRFLPPALVAALPAVLVGKSTAEPEAALLAMAPAAAARALRGVRLRVPRSKLPKAQPGPQSPEATTSPAPEMVPREPVAPSTVYEGVAPSSLAPADRAAGVRDLVNQQVRNARNLPRSHSEYLSASAERSIATVVGSADEVGASVGVKISGQNVGDCAEDLSRLSRTRSGAAPATLKYSTAIRPRTGEIRPVCPRCQRRTSQCQYPPGTPYEGQTEGFQWGEAPLPPYLQ